MSSRRPSSTLVAAAVGVVALGAVLVAGCDTDDGRALAEPAPGATAPSLPTGSTTSSSVVDQGTPPGMEGGTLVLGSPAFGGGSAIPLRYSCDGDDISPPLGWTGVPDGTVELALTVVDHDVDPSFVHWVIAGIDPALGGLEEDAVPAGAVEARNGTSEFGWFGPCPPGGEVHRYVFTLFALTEPSGVATGADGRAAIDLIAATPGVATTLTATYPGA
jgi:Raf kinase inhibitor-like YbhB/YbcL family protein